MSDNPFVADFAVWALALFLHVFVAIVDGAVIGKFAPVDGRVGSEINMVVEACTRYESAKLCRCAERKVHVSVIGVAACGYRKDFDVLFRCGVGGDLDCIVEGASATTACCNTSLWRYSPAIDGLVYGHVKFDFSASVGGLADMYRYIDTGV